MYVQNVVLYLILTEKIKFKIVFVKMDISTKVFPNVLNVVPYVPLVMIFLNVLLVNIQEMITD